MMGDRYTLILKCAYCGLGNVAGYAESSDITTFRCFCGKLNRIEMVFRSRKMRQPKEGAQDETPRV